MSLGQRLLELRKSKQLSQEEAASRLNVTRQTISKWETDQSTPDFDKIIPICDLYGISFDALLTGRKAEDTPTAAAMPTTEPATVHEISAAEPQPSAEAPDAEKMKQKKAKNTALAVLLYMIAAAWMVAAIPGLGVDPVLATGIFLLICGAATCIIVYSHMLYRQARPDDERRSRRIRQQINGILALVTLVIYFIISFATMAWYITWICFIIYILVTQIVKLLFLLRRD
ncbi:MAG: helix-turn-helix transcriptional regulator [Clostridia bacterium]|nr:helix-turn-helix transcriptional regulator [Clostridia bacterium]